MEALRRHERSFTIQRFQIPTLHVCSLYTIAGVICEASMETGSKTATHLIVFFFSFFFFNSLKTITCYVAGK